MCTYLCTGIFCHDKHVLSQPNGNLNITQGVESSLLGLHTIDLQISPYEHLQKFHSKPFFRGWKCNKKMKQAGAELCQAQVKLA